MGHPWRRKNKNAARFTREEDDAGRWGYRTGTSTSALVTSPPGGQKPNASILRRLRSHTGLKISGGAMKFPLCLTQMKQTASFKMVGSLLAIAPLWLMLAAANTS
jgi:hypothetical protein